MQNTQFSLTTPPVVVIIWSKSITPDFCRENPYGGTYYYQHHRQSGRRFRSHCAQGPVRQTGCQSGRQTYPWKMNQETYAGQMPHIIETAAAAGFQGLEAEFCMARPPLRPAGGGTGAANAASHGVRRPGSPSTLGAQLPNPGGGRAHGPGHRVSEAFSICPSDGFPPRGRQSPEQRRCP